MAPGHKLRVHFFCARVILDYFNDIIPEKRKKERLRGFEIIKETKL